MESNSMIQSEAQPRNWLELPAEVMSMILLKLGAIEILTSAQNVCSSWRKICKDPLMWRVIDMQGFSRSHRMNYNLEVMCEHAVERSCGQLVEIDIVYFGTSELLQYISQSSNQLRRLRFAYCYGISDKSFSEALSKLPLLEHLEITTCSFFVKTLKIVGQHCPLLKSLKLNKLFPGGMGCDDEAIAIAETMPKLHHLQILGNEITNIGLQAILDGCPDLESLDLRQCLNLDLAAGQLRQKCAERIKTLHLPHDHVDGYDSETSYVSDFVHHGDDMDVYFGFDEYGVYLDYDDFTKVNFPDYDDFTHLGFSDDDDFPEYY